MTDAPDENTAAPDAPSEEQAAGVAQQPDVDAAVTAAEAAKEHADEAAGEDA